MRSFTPVPPRASVLTLCVQLCVAFFLVSSAQAQSPAAQSPSPSPATISSWSGSISTGYLGTCTQSHTQLMQAPTSSPQRLFSASLLYWFHSRFARPTVYAYGLFDVQVRVWRQPLIINPSNTQCTGARGDDAAGADGQDGENSNEPPPPPGPPPVLVIQPDRAISCASIADEQLQEELARKFSLASRGVVCDDVFFSDQPSPFFRQLSVCGNHAGPG